MMLCKNGAKFHSFLNCAFDAHFGKSFAKLKFCLRFSKGGN